MSYQKTYYEFHWIPKLRDSVIMDDKIMEAAHSVNGNVVEIGNIHLENGYIVIAYAVCLQSPADLNDFKVYLPKSAEFTGWREISHKRFVNGSSFDYLSGDYKPEWGDLPFRIIDGIRELMYHNRGASKRVALRMLLRGKIRSAWEELKKFSESE